MLNIFPNTDILPKYYCRHEIRTLQHKITLFICLFLSCKTVQNVSFNFAQQEQNIMFEDLFTFLCSLTYLNILIHLKFFSSSKWFNVSKWDIISLTNLENIKNIKLNDFDSWQWLSFYLSFHLLSTSCSVSQSITSLLKKLTHLSQKNNIKFFHICLCLSCRALSNNVQYWENKYFNGWSCAM